MIFALLSPGGVAFMSYTGFNSVKTETRIIQKSRTMAWAIEHSWFVQTKSFKTGQNVPIGESPSKALTENQVSWLASKGLIDIDKLPRRDDILDKSTSNSLAKFLACL
jgi:hypothetical protein